MSKKPLRIAVIGNGRWGKNIIKTLNALPECAVSYTATRDYAFLLKKDDIDGVVIATPPKTHTKIALQFITKKIPTFIEKPMTTSVKDAVRLRDASKAARTAVFVGHIDLYNPAYIAAHAKIRTLGPIHAITSEGVSMGPFRGDTSVLFDWAPHNCAMVLDTVGQMPTSVQAWGESVLKPKSSLFDITTLRLTFPSGLVGTIHNSRLSPKKKRSLTVVGTKGSVVYSDTDVEKVLKFTHTISQKSASAPTESPIAIAYGTATPLTAEMQAFLKSIRTKRASKTDVYNGVAVVTILEAAEKSILKGGTRINIAKH